MDIAKKRTSPKRLRLSVLALVVVLTNPTGVFQAPPATQAPLSSDLRAPGLGGQAVSAPRAITLPEGPIVVDHTSVALFEQIPETYLQAAANLRMFFMDRSVGGNIDGGLDCLAYASDEVAPNYCVRHEHVVPAFSVSPSELNWARSGGYDRSRWVYQYWPESGCGEWYDKVGCFMSVLDPIIQQYDVVSFQFSYLEVGEASTIEDQPGGYLWNNPSRLDVFDQEAYEAAHPNQVFIYWTTSLSRGIGTDEATAFNDQMRQYAIANGHPLFDVADIVSHDPQGNPCYDNRDGVPYDNGNQSENYPNDGQNTLAICQHYTTEVDGGHLGSVSAGAIRVAKAFWVLMARIAGWDGGRLASPTSTPTPTRTVTPTPTPTRTPTATAAPAQIFADVPVTHWAHDYIEALYNAGFVTGCQTTPTRLYCPDRVLNRAESAVFVERGQHGALSAPPYPAPATPTFTDVASSFWGYGWIESLWTDGFTVGCATNPLAYCPDRSHTRAEGSVFFLRVRNGASYSPPAAVGLFTDVALTDWYAGWVEAAYNQGILPACRTSPLAFCPNTFLDRAWAAYGMVQAKGIPLP